MQPIAHGGCGPAPGPAEAAPVRYDALGSSLARVDPHPPIIAQVQPVAGDATTAGAHASEPARRNERRRV